MQRGTEGRGKRKEVKDSGTQGEGDGRKGEMKKGRRRKKETRKNHEMAERWTSQLVEPEDISVLGTLVA